MNRIISAVLLIAIIFAGADVAQAKKKKNKKENPIAGIWQQCQAIKSNDGTNKIIQLPTFKIMGKNGTYTAMIGRLSTIDAEHGNVSMQTGITQEGRYEIKNDSIYHEQIDKHYMVKVMEGTTSVIKYRFLDDEKKIIVLELSGGFFLGKITEVWYRVSPL